MSNIQSQDKKSPTPEASTTEQGKSWQNNQFQYPSSQFFAANNNYSGQTFVRPPTGSKAIPIINPNNKKVVQLPTKEEEASAENSRPTKIVDFKEQVKPDHPKVEEPINEAAEKDLKPAEDIKKDEIKDIKVEKLESEEIKVQESKPVEEIKKDETTKEIKEDESKPVEIKEDESKPVENKEEEPKPIKEVKFEDNKEAEPVEKAQKAVEEITNKEEENREICTGDRVVYEIAFMMKFKECRALPEGVNLTPFADINTEKSNERGGRSMSRRQGSERGRGPRLAGEGILRGNSNRGPRRQDSSGPGSPGGMERQGSNRNRSSRGGKSRRQPKEDTPLIAPEDVVPLAKSENRWVPKVQSEPATPKEDEAESEEEKLIPQDLIIRKVKSLLNKLTLEKFDSISSQIWDYAKQAEKEDDSLSLKTVIDLIFDKACDEPGFAVMWAQLAKRLYELTAANENIKNVNILEDKTEKPVCGGPLYRKYLLMRCQADFYKGWKSDIPKIDENAADVMLTDEYYAAVKLKRRGLGLVQFIGELYKFQMLSNNVMKECLRRLCSNIETPEDEETETMCKLITTVGKVFEASDTNNRQWLDVYFARMKEMYDSETLSSRVKFMILDVMDLRKSRWTLKRGGAPTGPTTIAQIHQEAKKANEEKEKETMKRSGSSRSLGTPISRQGSARSIPNHPR